MTPLSRLSLPAKTMGPEPIEVGALVAAAQGGDRRETLMVLRDLLASRLEDAPATAIAPMAKQLADVLRQLDEASGEGGDAVDEFTARRQARIADASGL
jgi:hypothetical protein